MEKNYKNSKEVLKQTNTWNLLEQHSKKYQIEKCQAMMVYLHNDF